MCLVWLRWKKWLLTLVECGGAVYVSRDEGGLRLLPHSVVPHPPDAALGWEKSSAWSGLDVVPLLFKAFGPEDWVDQRACDSNLLLYTKFNSLAAWWRVCAGAQQSAPLIQREPKNGYAENPIVCNLRARACAAFFSCFLPTVREGKKQLPYSQRCSWHRSHKVTIQDIIRAVVCPIQFSVF